MKNRGKNLELSNKNIDCVDNGIIKDDANVYSVTKFYDDIWGLLEHRTEQGYLLGFEKNIYIQIDNLLIPATDKEIKIILQ